MECSDHIGPLLGQCSHMAKRMMQRHMQRYGFTPVQAHAMAFLIRNQNQEETTQQELERFLKVRPSTANGVVTRLEDQGFITRAPGLADARHHPEHHAGQQHDDGDDNQHLNEGKAFILHGSESENAERNNRWGGGRRLSRSSAR